jgi:hypothetical protein
MPFSDTENAAILELEREEASGAGISNWDEVVTGADAVVQETPPEPEPEATPVPEAEVAPEPVEEPVEDAPVEADAPKADPVAEGGDEPPEATPASFSQADLDERLEQSRTDAKSAYERNLAEQRAQWEADAKETERKASWANLSTAERGKLLVEESEREERIQELAPIVRERVLAEIQQSSGPTVVKAFGYSASLEEWPESTLAAYKEAGLKGSDFLGHVTWLHTDALRLQSERLATEHAEAQQKALDTLRSELTGVETESNGATARSGESDPAISGTPGQSGDFTLADYETKISADTMTTADWTAYQKKSAEAGFALTGHW